MSSALSVVPDDATTPAVDAEPTTRPARPEPGRRSFKTMAAARRALRLALPRIPRNRIGVSSDGTEYRYADLDQVDWYVMPFVLAYGLDWWAVPTISERTGKMVLAYALTHVKTGETLAGEWEIKGGHAQDQGAQVTYFARYSLQAVTGAIVEGEDNDCSRAPRPTPAASARTETAPPAAAAPVRPAPTTATSSSRVTGDRLNDAVKAIFEAKTVTGAEGRAKWVRRERIDTEHVDPPQHVRDVLGLPPGPISLGDLALAQVDHLTAARDAARNAAGNVDAARTRTLTPPPAAVEQTAEQDGQRQDPAGEDEHPYDHVADADGDVPPPSDF